MLCRAPSHGGGGVADAPGGHCAPFQHHRGHSIKAFAYTRYGPPEVLQLIGLPTPGPAAERSESVHELVRLAEAGHFNPVIDRCHPFAQMREAHHQVDLGHKRGGVVVRLDDAHA